MNCPYCGSEVRENEKFCQNCGAQLAQSAPSAPAPVQNEEPVYQPTYTAPAAENTARPQNLKEFISSPYCTPDVNKNIKTSWIILFICAGISALVQIVGGSFPIDGILMAAIAVWLMRSKSYAAGVTACVVGLIEMIVTSIVMGRFAGFLPAIAGVYALTAVLKARKQYKAFLGQ